MIEKTRKYNISQADCRTQQKAQNFVNIITTLTSEGRNMIYFSVCSELASVTSFSVGNKIHSVKIRS